jgi:hypothetical protein
MPDAKPNAELLRSLGRLVRGLSALFWGLPAALVICFHTAKAEGLRTFGVGPPLAATGLLVYGLWQMGAFQKQERVWRNALDVARLLALVNFGLSPFLYWWNQVPGNRFFLWASVALMISALLFLGSLNFVLRRLGAMLPDETLRLEIKQFTALNFNLLGATLILGSAYGVLIHFHSLPLYFQAVLMVLDRGGLWLLVVLVLLPLAMTMALIWKTKEVIMDSVFAPHG